MSRAAPFWALTVVEMDTYAILERYEAGELVCSIWNSPGEFGQLRSFGDIPFDLATVSYTHLTLPTIYSV